ncbi:MAG TPA: hypothetical protein VKC58_03755, partial [Myxococcales bacterium]|nr:hypothetical protein [Myxococcales bacterium]
MEPTEELESTAPFRGVRGPVAYRDLERIARALEAASEGDFRARAQVEDDGALGRIASAANRLIALNGGLAREMTRVARRIGVDGVLQERASPAALPGSYGDVLSSL